MKDTINPDDAVEDSSLENILLKDVTTLSLGINTEEGLTSVIIPCNTKIPIRKTKMYNYVHTS